ncbi:MAG: UDP-N-acetylmuramoyl-L-alanyl-D-glutamate--2,6-diaminopimelate ligase [Thermodesulfovibrio sp.]|nr:UDP-N-acetylmuramoyl-L-alanyl-D-glutamate--2,6-diaminopimelate ligase [Thermodesulfovibrio sp.]
MKLYEILREDFEVSGDINIEFNDVQYNSKETRKGSLFVAIAGHNMDGHNFIREALDKGAIAVVYEKIRYNPLNNENITWIGVNDSRDALAWIANRFYGSPSNGLHLIGITGTNGKTTTSYLIREILKKDGKKTGVIGTIKYLIDEDEISAKHTTPEALQFQHLLWEMLQKGIEYVISEVSSHALALKRVDYSSFEVAVFTNLSRDHLDFHSNMEDYFQAKKRLFTELLREDGISVINIDDEYGKRLVKEIKGKKLLYSINDKKADIYVEDYKLMFNGTEIRVSIDGESHLFKTPLLGIPNIYNVLSAISVALYLNVPLNTIKSALLNVKAPDGRFENIDEGQQFLVFVDYAHTPDALERLLKSVIKLREGIGHVGRIITIFGCGGNRDKGKRPQMGKIATELSDYVILTSDNPRWEEPRQIIREIEEGISKDNFIVVPDRSDALMIGISICEKGDILIVAGKGHEDYQEIEGKRFPFSDREILRKLLKELKK